mgnify:CR=1 FL=1
MMSTTTRSNRTARISLVAVVLVVGALMAGCVVTPPANQTSRACVPSGALLPGQAVIAISSASEGSSLRVLSGGYFPGEFSDFREAERSFDNLSAGQKLTLDGAFAPDPGKCIEVEVTGAVSYQVTFIPAPLPNQIMYLLFGDTLRGGVIYGL